MTQVTRIMAAFATSTAPLVAAPAPVGGSSLVKPAAEVWFETSDGRLIDLTFTISEDRSTDEVTWLEGHGTIAADKEVVGSVKLRLPYDPAPAGLFVADHNAALLRLPESPHLLTIQRRPRPDQNVEDIQVWSASGHVADMSLDSAFADRLGGHAGLSLTAAVSTVILAPECTPSFGECTGAADAACGELEYQVTYECNPQTQEVHCSWTCVTEGGT